MANTKGQGPIETGSMASHTTPASTWYRGANDASRQAQADLDAIQADKSAASRQRPQDVVQGVLDTAGAWGTADQRNND